MKRLNHRAIAHLATASLLLLVSTTCANTRPVDTNLSPATASSVRAGQTAIGINISGVADWSTEIPFVDVFKMSRSWIAQREGAAWGQGGPLKLTPEGWVASLEPGQSADTVIFADGKHYPTGQYVLLYEGQGEWAIGANSATIVSQAPGRMVLDVPSKGGGIWLQIRKTDPANPIRNVRLILPGFEATYQKQPFHPKFLSLMSQFKVIRFMDWGQTNNSPVKEWADRSTPQLATQTTEKGVALEHMIALANQLKRDPWFTIPHQASDDYVRQFAQMVRDRLDPNLKPHVEYSNEIWNSIFGQTRYAQERGRTLGLSDNDFQATLRYYSQRSVEIFKIWDQVFGDQKSRVIHVLASQSANPWTGEQVLTWQDAYKHADVYAIAPYIDGGELSDPNQADAITRMTPEQVIDRLFAGLRSDVKSKIAQNAALAQKHGLKLVAYEGGTHLTSGQMPADKEPQITALYTGVNRHPRMRELYREYLATWQAAGGGLFNQFSSISAYSKWGSWGMLEYQDQDPKTAPKYQGLLDFMQSQPKHSSN